MSWPPRAISRPEPWEEVKLWEEFARHAERHPYRVAIVSHRLAEWRSVVAQFLTRAPGVKDALPKTASGKTQKFALREELSTA